MLRQKIENRIEEINGRLKKYLEIKYPEIIYEAMNYSVFAGGKRLRPLLLLSAFEAFNENYENAMPFACAMELIHTYSLVHDDLPAMDDDDYRRGKLTSHKMFGEAIAILCGDALLNKAFEIMCDFMFENVKKENAEAMKVIAESAGLNGMIGGQVADMLSEKNKNSGQAELLYIHEHKTAAIIKASICAGAILGGASSENISKLEKAGSKLGLAFQIKDDILDVTSTSEILGKNVLSDEKNNKLTYIRLYGLEASQKEYELLCREALLIIEEVVSKDSFLYEITMDLTKRKK